MKKHRRPLHLIAILISVALGVVGYADNAAAPLPPSNAVVMIILGPAQPAPSAPVSPGILPDLELNPARWIDIKDCTSDRRVAFFAGLKRLEAKLSEQIAELTAIRAGMTNTSTVKNWDLAMQAMNGARFQLKTTGELLSKATPQTWEFQKAKVGQAWARTQEAYAKVKACPTE